MADHHTPLYKQVADQIKEHLTDDAYDSSGKLPSEAALMEEYGCSRVTIRNAIDELIRSGHIERIPHRGIYVKKNKFSVMQSSSFNHIFESNCDDFSISHAILAFGTINADKTLSAAFRCQEGTPLYHLKILRKQNEVPFVLQDTFLRVSLMPKLDIYLLKDRTLHDIIENHYHHSISHINQSISITKPDEEQCRYLHATGADSLLQVTDTLFIKGNPDNEVIRYGTATYGMNVGYQYTIHVTKKKKK